MRHVNGRDNLLTLANHNAPVCVECKGCGHRGTADKETLEAFGNTFPNGNMTTLRSFKYVCHKCRGREVELFVPHNRQAAVDWVQRLSGE